MKTYYVNNNAQSNGDHEVHEEGCMDMPSSKKTWEVIRLVRWPFLKPQKRIPKE